MWLISALAGYIILAIVAISDKFILSKKVSPLVFVFYSIIFLLFIFLLLPFGVRFLNTGWDWFLAFVSGLGFALGLWTMYLGVKKSEVSHVGPLIGAVIPFFVFIFGRVFLGELLNNTQILALAFLIVGSLIISFEISQQHRGWHSGMIWGVASGLFFAISHVAAKYIYARYGFYSGLVWTRGAIGVCGALLMLSPALWRDLSRKNNGRRGNNLFMVLCNSALGVAGALFIQYAIAIGSVTLVNALAGLQFAALVIMVALLSKFIPRWFKETYTRAEVWQEITAVVLIGIGLALLL